MERSRLLECQRLPIYPTFFLCTGVSGAGCTTATFQIAQLGLANLAPAQFTTRALRTNEIKGEQYHSVSDEVLKKIERQIALRDQFGGNIYGLFHPAIKRIQTQLETQNVIIDSASPPNKWQLVLGDKYNIVSLFFAPKYPSIALERIINRAQQSGESFQTDYLSTRARANAEYICHIAEYNYWVDTTKFADVLPIVKDIIEVESFEGKTNNIKIIRVAKHRNEVQQLIELYNQNIESMEFSINNS